MSIIERIEKLESEKADVYRLQNKIECLEIEISQLKRAIGISRIPRERVGKVWVKAWNNIKNNILNRMNHSIKERGNYGKIYLYKW